METVQYFLNELGMKWNHISMHLVEIIIFFKLFENFDFWNTLFSKYVPAFLGALLIILEGLMLFSYKNESPCGTKWKLFHDFIAAIFGSVGG